MKKAATCIENRKCAQKTDRNGSQCCYRSVINKIHVDKKTKTNEAKKEKTSSQSPKEKPLFLFLFCFACKSLRFSVQARKHHFKVYNGTTPVIQLVVTKCCS